MFDIWGFLLQTLTASGVALLILVIKGMFRDKLPPRWQFGIWAVLGIALVIPAGLGGRYVLFNWPLAVEVLKTMISGAYTYTRVLFPFPALKITMPHTLSEWLYAVYLLGVILHLARYAIACLKLQNILRQGRETDESLMQQINRIAAEQNVKVGSVVTVQGLPSAFVCGIFRPILALPSDHQIDDKILLHELLHLKSRDSIWSIVICILRSIHWCNPLLVYCAKRAGNDLEARCDQRVLELLEGEDRRDYGRILLSMANDRFAQTPGATCANNGGKNIRRRIEAIARFKLYPVGMELVSVCAAIILALPLILGVEATEVYSLNHHTPAYVAFASARATPCTTPAGAFDAYGKAILDQNAIYRAMCAPADMQKELAESVTERYENGNYPYWDTGLDASANAQDGYHIYNLRQVSNHVYEAMLVIGLNYRPDGQETEFGRMVLACQDVRVEKEGHRWVAVPINDFWWGEYTKQQFSWGAAELPAYRYAATAENMLVEVKVQTIHAIDNQITHENDMSFLFGSSTSYDMVPKPNAEFDWVRYSRINVITHLGTREERDQINRIGLSSATITEGEDRPFLSMPAADGAGSSNQGTSWASRELENGWDPVVYLNGSGSSGDPDVLGAHLPYGFAADLYINGNKVAELDLIPQEGGPK